MSQKIKDLLEKRGKCVADARTLLDKAEKEGRAGKLNADEQKTYDALMKDQDDFRAAIEQEKRISDLEAEMEKPVRESSTSKSITQTSAKTPEIRSNRTEIDTPEYRTAFQKYLIGGLNGLNSDEVRALSQGDNSQGGYLVQAQQFVAQLIKFVDDQVFIRQKATVFKLNKAISLGYPSWDTDPADADWTTEIATGSEDSSARTGKRELVPQPMAKLIKESQTFLRNSAIPADTLIMQRLAYKFAITEEKGFLTGNGANQPLGVFTASTNGISTGRDVSTGNTTSSPTFDGLKAAKYTLKGQYWANASWLFHRTCMSLIAQLKDTTNQYLWQPSNQAGEPDQLLGFPVMMSEYVPNTFTTGLYVGMLGDFSKYYIADSLEMTVQRLNELYAATNQVGFIGRIETDGMPVLEEAFVRVKLG